MFKSMKKIMVMAVAMMFIFTGIAYSQTIDLNDWSQQGTPSAGNWDVAVDGSNVLQTINGAPTYFVSSDTYIDYTFEGKFQVQTTSDNDYIGFVFGWNGLDDYYLFDWKEQDQSWGGYGYEGFRVSHITDDSEVDYWTYEGTGIEVLDTMLSPDFGPDLGWNNNQMYDFTLNYTQTGFTIDIDGIEIFNETGTFSTGNFGFYNYSQAHVFYQGFEADENPPVGVPEPATMVLLGTCLAGLGVVGRKKLVK